MNMAHWIILVFTLISVVGQIVKHALNENWHRRPGVMIMSVTIGTAANAVWLWALHAIGAFPWMRQ